jgi:hypothetical protein
MHGGWNAYLVVPLAFSHVAALLIAWLIEVGLRHQDEGLDAHQHLKGTVKATQADTT